MFWLIETGSLNFETCSFDFFKIIFFKFKNLQVQLKKRSDFITKLEYGVLQQVETENCEGIKFYNKLKSIIYL
jgi:hypothetical protein